MKKPVFNPTLSAMAAVFFAAFGVTGAADAEPVSLTLSQSFMHDSNFSRNEAKNSEQISTTGLGLALDKSYGRQHYTANGRFAIERYKNFGDLLNNESKDVGLGFSSGLASNWIVSANGSYSENLNPIQSNTSTSQQVIKNIRKTRSGNLSAQYGASGKLAIVGSVGTSDLSYSLSQYAQENRDQNTAGLKVIYYNTDTLNFGVGARRVDSTYRDVPSASGVVPGDRIHQNNLDLSTSWQITGLSNLSSTISWSQQTRSRLEGGRENGFSGSLDWAYTPRGTVSYALSLNRTSGEDQYSQTKVEERGSGIFRQTIEDVFRDTTTTSLTGSARWQLTGKVSLQGSLTAIQFKNRATTQVRDESAQTLPSDGSTYRGWSLGGGYQYSRALGFNCSLQQYKQSRDSRRVAYDGRQISCTASFTVD